ncbi:protein FAM200C-like [Oratosquilla oratoria]|uniref:protein FAM200C-like n=1 Tax=Oratosquilla oratoria TaxID=337810 RepID=UPI003F76D834
MSNEGMRPCKLKKKNLETAHKDKKDKLLEFFKNLSDEFQGRMAVNRMFTQKVAKIERGMLVSYKISNLIAKAGKLHTIGESPIMPPVAIVLSTVMKSTRDIIEKLNVLNKELQGNDSSLFSRKEVITAFIGKHKLFWLNIGRWEFAQFPSLASISTELLDADLAVYVDHLKQLHNDVETCFSGLLQMTVPDWFVDPFIANISEVDVTLYESVIELQNDTTARFQDVYEKYPLLWKEVKLFLLAFPTSYLVETGFSRVMHLLSKTRNRLGTEERGDLRLSLTSMEPNIDKLAALHQSQGSH